MPTSYNLHPTSLLQWLPRILAIIYIAFISIFALDVFGQNFSFVALFMHLLPTFFVTICLLVAWRHELIGAVLFGSFAMAYIIVIFFRFEWLTFLFIGLPLLVIGALFFVSALTKIKIELVDIVDANGRRTGEVLTAETAKTKNLRYTKID